jgi:hypothetical protein
VQAVSRKHNWIFFCGDFEGIAEDVMDSVDARKNPTMVMRDASNGDESVNPRK